jgi:hypothetical protein
VNWRPYAQQLAEQVTHPISRWRPIIAAVPRHVLVPFWWNWASPGSGYGIEWDRAGFMQTRTGRDYPPTLHPVLDEIRDADGDHISTARYPVINVVEAWELWSTLAILHPGIEHHYEQHDTGPDSTRTAFMLHSDGSWARATSRGDDPPMVHQRGPRRLWDLLDDIRTTWLHNGSLPVYGAQATVTPDGTIQLRRGRWQATIP